MQSARSRTFFHPYQLGSLGCLAALFLQIARDCPEGREPVVEEEEDNAWGEIEGDDPWSGGGTFAADGN